MIIINFSSTYPPSFLLFPLMSRFLLERVKKKTCILSGRFRQGHPPPPELLADIAILVFLNVYKYIYFWNKKSLKWMILNEEEKFGSKGKTLPSIFLLLWEKSFHFSEAGGSTPPLTDASAQNASFFKCSLSFKKTKTTFFWSCGIS